MGQRLWTQTGTAHVTGAGYAPEARYVAPVTRCLARGAPILRLLQSYAIELMDEHVAERAVVAVRVVLPIHV